MLKTLARGCLNTVGVKLLRWHGNILLTPINRNPLETEFELGRIALNLHLQGVLQSLAINCVFDVGANAG